MSEKEIPEDIIEAAKKFEKDKKAEEIENEDEENKKEGNEEVKKDIEKDEEEWEKFDAEIQLFFSIEDIPFKEKILSAEQKTKEIEEKIDRGDGIFEDIAKITILLGRSMSLCKDKRQYELAEIYRTRLKNMLGILEEAKRRKEKFLKSNS